MVNGNVLRWVVKSLVHFLLFHYTTLYKAKISPQYLHSILRFELFKNSQKDISQLDVMFHLFLEKKIMRKYRSMLSGLSLREIALENLSI